MNIKNKTCLVTGASGFIGKRLCSKLKMHKANVRVLNHAVDQAGVWDASYVCDLGAQKIPENLMDGVDIIFHLAGRAHSLSDNKNHDSLYFKTNVDGTKSLLEAAAKAGVKKFIYFSSVKSMGEESDFRLDEDSSAQPQTAYGKSKKEAEDLVLRGEYIEQPTVLRLVMVYGDSKKGNLPKMIKAVSLNKFPPLPNFKNKRSMIYVGDVVEAAVVVMRNEFSAGQIYILTDGIDYSTREIYENICQSLNKNIPKWEVPIGFLRIIAKVGDFSKLYLGKRILFDSDNLQKLIGSSYFSSEKIKTELGFVAKHDLYSLMPEIIMNLLADTKDE